MEKSTYKRQIVENYDRHNFLYILKTKPSAHLDRPMFTCVLYIYEIIYNNYSSDYWAGLRKMFLTFCSTCFLYKCL